MGKAHEGVLFVKVRSILDVQESLITVADWPVGGWRSIDVSWMDGRWLTT
jgi:hypothetical protein